jgi:hypothetical protein
MARVPRSRRNMLHADLCIFLGPDFIEAPVVEQGGHVQRIAAGKGEVAAEYRNFGGRRHAVIIRLHRIDCPALHGLEQLVRGHKLIGIKQVDLHFVACDGVEQVNRGFRHLRAQRGARIGLQPPADCGLCVHRRCGEHCGTAKCAGGQELPSGCHGSSSCWLSDVKGLRQPKRDLGECHDQRQAQHHHRHKGRNGAVDIGKAHLGRGHRAHEEQVIAERAASYKRSGR